MIVILLPVPYGAIIVMQRIRMQSGRDLGKHPKSKARQILNKKISQHFSHPITIGPTSKYSTNVISFTRRFCASSTVNQIQQVDTSIMVAQNMVPGMSPPSAPSYMPRTKSLSYGSKGAQVF
jgi:hypothetical protein